MKKRILILSSLLICSCSLSNSFDFKKLEDVGSFNELTIGEELYVNGENIASKTATYKKDDYFNGYACIINRNSTYYNTDQSASVVEEYNLNNLYMIKTGKNSFNYDVDSSSILAFRGFDDIFNQAIEQKKVKSSIKVLNVMEVVRDFYYDLGYIVDYSSFIDDFSLNYEFYITNDIVNLKIDMLPVMKKLFPLVEFVSKTYTFKNTFDNAMFIDYPLDDSDDKVDETLKKEELKKASSDYIKNVYSKLEYVSNDINLLMYCPKSRRLTYEYISSNTSVLSNDGKFNAPINDENITLKVKLKIDDEVFEEQSFNFIAHKPITRNGILGSKENSLYQGRKKIDKVDIYFIEMHKEYGDSIYIKAGDFDMLIDAGSGNDGYYVSQMLKENMVDSTLDLVVATHAHSDHIGGMQTALSVPTKIMYALDYGYDRSDYSVSSKVRDQMIEKSEKYSAITDALNENNGIIYISDDFYITLLNTGQYISKGTDIGNGDDNSASVTFIMTYKNHSYYFSGDLDKNGESYLVSSKQLKKVNLMKATHHGSNNGNTTNVLNKLKPEMVVVSTALVNRGSTNENSKNQTHPTESALNRFNSAGAKTYCNFTMGTVHVTSSGNGNLSIEGLGVTSPYYINGNKISGEENSEFKNTAWAKYFR